ncbi:hypothetical protein IJH66_00205 [Candidatus Saccharibacteria bacterium]|nr:hypothetical protein [Candidatus Saccharibacteria bacterium]MBQ6605400.1 hypothetical protein [Candidatus Saccharibacteria bacterium]
MNNDELQKAIDDITKSDVGGATESASENDALVDEMVQAGMPTTGEAPALAPIGGETATPEIAAVPEIQIPEIGAMPPVAEEKTEAPAETTTEPAVAVETAPVAPEVSATVPEAPVTEPAAAEVNVPEIGKTESGKEDLGEIEKEALKELYPLLDKVTLPAEEKFEICMKVAEEDKGAIKGALEAAKGFTDETKKAEALLKVIEAVK